jgi:DNA-binding YbaB/EbfC family protein
MQALMQQAQRMQREMEKAQKDLEAKEFEIVSAGGGIKIVIQGTKEIKSIDIDQDMIDPDDKDMLQDLLTVAINEAIKKVDDEMSKVMNEATGGMRMPGMF